MTADETLRRDYADIAAALDPAGYPSMQFVHRTGGSPSKVAVLSASFNPPTLAHLRMAEIAHEDLGYPEVVLELAIANVDKAVTDAPLHERLMMMRAIAAPRPWTSVAIATHGRFLDKMTALREHFPSADVCFIVGYDTLVRVFDPKYYADRAAELRALFDQTSFACANRVGSGDGALASLLRAPENATYADGVSSMALDPYHAGLSSTAIRASLASGGVPEEVVAYLAERPLYG
ncbi:nicotinate-nicotinamide nucleotide adenylyltransferase [Candidatus Poribacteria bacterium]|nr:nicotinate-nicotinamide nucleotide adenylyltransferase [Candidatus Poribacteria bacterium]MBT5535870.1 nicotinate-nicotinamide nucleotide adenylyltransferase [Candidatus Poribacteria bacterium]MBT7100016.1 nicotinate-nicotinamide nucleotide adenylyltransferase [Candidatus Poribacteria bacterium]MBT7804914.1 nicotinate-nicotinamide nucleotide adenylyltransferase [Candidatus Poribacteria bacterium]